MTKITIISDLHGNCKQLQLIDGDILLCTGDWSNLGKHDEVSSFLAWFDKQEYNHKAYIAGNHDISWQRNIPMKKKFLALYSDIHYLEDSGITLEGLKIYGSPWSPEFGSYWVYNLPRGSRYLKEKWDKVPDDTDILMTHTAPYGILDPNYEYQSVGCELLRDRIIDIKPLISCFGHLHRGYNVKRIDLGNKTTTFINSSICNDNNQVVNKPINLTIENRYVEIIDD